MTPQTVGCDYFTGTIAYVRIERPPYPVRARPAARLTP